MRVKTVALLAFLTSIVVGLCFGMALHLSRLLNLQAYIGIFLATVLVFLISDFTSKFFMRGGHGIVQVPVMHGTRAVTKVVAFLVLFFLIPAVGIMTDHTAQQLTVFVETGQFQLVVDLVTGLVLSLLVYFDLELKFYGR
jgi:hypothetical protein